MYTVLLIYLNRCQILDLCGAIPFFPFENMLKAIGYLYSGTRNVGDQIVDNFLLRQQLSRCKLSLDDVIDNFTVNLRLRRHRSVRKNTLQVAPNIDFFLPMAQESLTWREKQELIRFAIASVTEQVKTTARAIIKHEVFHSQS
ncbi:uncharacterized protein LOC134185597 isoform X2 [Corticium candelabrum]|uniref:uncharacterized protein LOC134185597 isoform X2 n=1 Tax=Corticium candelabrum TaxID=121492 RepID=UPI002E25C926|nr:uncharacterized protein LOC134185597 isoform X2 [Corticium candelabrum]